MADVANESNVGVNADSLDENIVTFDVVICDNNVDRANDAFTVEALKDIVNIINSLGSVPYIKNHDMSDVENIIANIKSAELVVDDSRKNTFGETYVYVLGKASAKKGSSEYLDKIISGLWRNSSIRSVNVYEVENGINKIVHVEDVVEVSSVCVGCQPMARVCLKSVPIEGNKYKATFDVALEEKKNKAGGNTMKKMSMLFKRMSTIKGMPAEAEELVKEASETPVDAELTDDDYNALLEELKACKAENEQLRAELETCKGEVEQLKACANKACIGAEVEKAVSALNPLTEQVKSDIIEKIDTDKVEICEDGTVKGLSEQIEAVKKSYDGLFKKAEPEVKAEVKTAEAVKTWNPDFTIGKKVESTAKSMSEGFGL